MYANVKLKFHYNLALEVIHKVSETQKIYRLESRKFGTEYSHRFVAERIHNLKI